MAVGDSGCSKLTTFPGGGNGGGELETKLNSAQLQLGLYNSLVSTFTATVFAASQQPNVKRLLQH